MLEHPILRSIRNGNLKVRGRIRVVKLENYYSMSRHTTKLVAAMARSIILREYDGDRDIIERCISNPTADLFLHSLPDPTSIKDYVIIDYSILWKDPSFLTTNSKLKSDLLVEMYRIGKG